MNDLDELRRRVADLERELADVRATAEVLHASEELNRRIIDSVPAGIVELDRHGTFRRANREAERILGLRHDDLSHRYALDFGPLTITEEGTPFLVADYPAMKCLETGRAQPPVTIGVRRPDGTTSWAIYSAFPLVDPASGVTEGTVVTIFDITERKQAESARAESEARLDRALVTSNTGLWDAHFPTGQVYYSPTWKRQIGYEDHEIGATLDEWRDRLHPDERAAILGNVARYVADPWPNFEHEFRLRHRDGSYRWILSRAASFRGADGTVERMIGTHVDITERRQAEEALRESETRFRQMAESIRDVFYLADPVTMQQLYVSPAFEELWGRPLKDVYDNPQVIFDAIVPEDLPYAQAMTQRTLRGERLVADFRIRRPDGQVRWMRSHNFPVFDSQGRFFRVAGLVEDITPYRQAEEQLRQSEEFHRVISEIAADYAYTCSVEPDGTYPLTSVTAGFTRMTGYTLEEIQERGNWPALIHPDDLWLAAATQPEFIHGRRHVFELRIRTKAGATRWIRYTVHPIREESTGRVVRLLGAVTDITEQVLAEKERQENARRLQALSRRLLEVQEDERRHLARELHDEIGQILTGLQLNLEHGARPWPTGAPPPLEEAWRLVRDLTARVRDLSLRLRPTMLDDLGLHPALLWHLNRYAAQTNVDVDFDAAGLQRRFPANVETAAYRIVQEALTNVARHAEVARASVRLWQDNGTLRLQVADRGRGFDLVATRAAQQTSGLSGMQERALLLGGCLEIESHPGDGTTISAALPISLETDEGS